MRTPRSRLDGVECPDPFLENHYDRLADCSVHIAAVGANVSAEEFAECHQSIDGRSSPVCRCAGPRLVDAGRAGGRQRCPLVGTPAVDRARVMFRYRELLDRNAEELARLVTREHGKTLAEARPRCSAASKWSSSPAAFPACSWAKRCRISPPTSIARRMRHPVGVCVGITPFNFPAMVPLWMFPVALACGNTFILKPSEKVPAVGRSARRTAGRMRRARGRLQHRARRQGMRGCAADASAGGRDLVRRLDGRGEVCLRNWHANTANACRRPAARRTT